MKDSGKIATGLVTIIILIVGFVLFAQYAVATNPCNTKAYKRSLPSYSSYSSSTTYKPSSTQKPTAKPSATLKRNTKKSSSFGVKASDYYHPDDFYYDYYDDFYDYEEAEDYYYSHGGK